MLLHLQYTTPLSSGVFASSATCTAIVASVSDVKGTGLIHPK